MSLLVMLVCIALVVVLLLLTWTRWSLGHGTRVLLRGLGLVLFVVGLYLTHLADLAGNGIRSIYDWAMRTHMGTRLTAGFAVAGLGLVLFLAGSLMRRRTRDEAREVRRTRKGTAVTTGAPAAGVAPAARPAAGRKPATTAGLDDEDAEIAAILDRRGIN